jgi:hypothetical protein
MNHDKEKNRIGVMKTKAETQNFKFLFITSRELEGLKRLF